MGNDLSFDQNTLKEQLIKYKKLNDKIDKIKKQQNEIRKYVANYMHKINEHEVYVDTDKGQFKISYETRTFNKIDQRALREILTEEMYKQVYSKKQSISLVIRQMKKPVTDREENDLTSNIPKKEEVKTPVPDIGVLS